MKLKNRALFGLHMMCIEKCIYQSAKIWKHISYRGNQVELNSWVLISRCHSVCKLFRQPSNMVKYAHYSLEDQRTATDTERICEGDNGRTVERSGGWSRRAHTWGSKSGRIRRRPVVKFNGSRSDREVESVDWSRIRGGLDLLTATLSYEILRIEKHM